MGILEPDLSHGEANYDVGYGLSKDGLMELTSHYIYIYIPIIAQMNQI